MSRKLKAEDIKVGMLVRVAGRAFSGPQTSGYVRHHIKAGAVCEVVRVQGRSVDIVGPERHDTRYGNKPNGHTRVFHNQTVKAHQITRAKQATKKATK